MTGYPITYGDIKDNDVNLTQLAKISKIVIFVSVVNTLTSPVAFAADEVAKQATKRSARAILTLIAIDAAACAKSKGCVETVVDKTKDNPKFATVIVCAGVIAWCARGITERVINHHL